ncbi:hypothetical protein BO70DRAFT_23341 [Aspergillus heteromorphus CBS 117.55]|uniref:Uncharacterized protein n=1 Tax=Aspergillus heteromorphus CBS 117.55 TaxID=1448321 RepID=A0A317WGM9_9EURO|nr:uncharacterized protein BO70DRAFT_23341 [Aspergillus heteromorphus CBS 117.55]PWY83350.1 hypothetical protein BO70DRAFT_23341 [Aspergillus heteromorphus CBS 117.55]
MPASSPCDSPRRPIGLMGRVASPDREGLAGGAASHPLDRSSSRIHLPPLASTLILVQHSSAPSPSRSLAATPVGWTRLQRCMARMQARGTRLDRGSGGEGKTAFSGNMGRRSVAQMACRRSARGTPASEVRGLRPGLVWIYLWEMSPQVFRLECVRRLQFGF